MNEQKLIARKASVVEGGWVGLFAILCPVTLPVKNYPSHSYSKSFLTYDNILTDRKTKENHLTLLTKYYSCLD